MTVAVTSKGTKETSGSFANLMNFASPLYLFLCVTRFYFEKPEIYLFVSVFLVSAGWALLVASITFRPIKINVLIIILTLVISALIAGLSDRGDVFNPLIQFIGNIGFSLAFMNSSQSVRLHFLLCVGVVIFFGFFLATGVNPEDVFTLSRNYVSIIVLIAATFYLASCQTHKRLPSALLMLALMFVMLWAIGRAGIICGAVLLIGTFLLTIQRMRSLFFSLIAVSVLALSFQGLILQNYDVFFAGIERFETLSTESERAKINAEYFEAITEDPVELLMGGDPAKIASIQDVDGNPHNSFINLHITFGLLGFVCIAAASVLAAVRFLRKREWTILLAFSVLLLRVVFDTAAFHGQLDVGIMYSIFLGVSSPSNSRKRA